LSTRFYGVEGRLNCGLEKRFVPTEKADLSLVTCH
jgi:hypothetical protein